MKNVILTISMLMVLLVGMGLVNAQVDLEREGFDFFSWLGHSFGLGEFSIVGDFRQCDAYPTETINVNYENTANVQASSYCSSGYGLIDVFDGNWNPIREFRNNVHFNCVDSDGCIAEVYCCDHDECSSDSQCSSWYGAGSNCVSRNADDPNIPYQYPSFRYCTLQTGQQITCYYYPGSGESCLTRTYLGQDSCPATYMGHALYESESQCEGNIEEPEEPEPEPEQREAITFTTFYSISDGDFAKKASSCRSTSECLPKEGYSVSCETSELFSDRIYNAAEDACRDQLGFLFRSLSDLISFLLPGPELNICDIYAEGKQTWRETFEGTGFCVAESETWYGELWEDTLKIVDSIGIPSQYVLIVTIFLILISLGFMVNFIK